MDSYYDYKKFAILFVDDDEGSLRQFPGTFSEDFRIFTANNAQQGLKVLEEHKEEIGLLLTDQRMPGGESGVWLLERARQLQLGIVRILSTAYTDYDAAIAAVNTGAIYKYISKPWDLAQLELTLKRGLEFFIVQRERDDLLREKMSVLYNMMVADRIVSLGLLATGLAHHIRNSLQAVRTFVDLAPTRMEEEKMDLSGLRNPDFWKEYYQNVQSQISRINGLLTDLCSASQKPEFQFADHIPLRAFVSDVIEGLREELGARKLVVENKIPESLPKLFVDKPKFRRLFELLLKDELVTTEEQHDLDKLGIAKNSGEEKKRARDANAKARGAQKNDAAYDARMAALYREVVLKEKPAVSEGGFIPLDTLAKSNGNGNGLHGIAPAPAVKPAVGEPVAAD